MLSDIHREIYDSIYIHLSSDFEPPVNVVSEKIEDKNTREKFIEISFDLNKFTPSFQMAIECLVRLETQIKNNQLDLLREKIKSDDSILPELLNLEKEIVEIKNKYDE